MGPPPKTANDRVAHAAVEGNKRGGGTPPRHASELWAEEVVDEADTAVSVAKNDSAAEEAGGRASLPLSRHKSWWSFFGCTGVLALILLSVVLAFSIVTVYRCVVILTRPTRS